MATAKTRYVSEYIVDTAKAVASARKLDSSLDQLHSRGSGVKSLFGTLFAGFSAAAVLNELKNVLRELVAFERGLIGVGKTSNLTGADLALLGDQIERLSIDPDRIGTTTDELLAIAEAAGQVGVDGSKGILAFTDTLDMLQATTDIIGDEGARNLAKLLNITGENAETVGRLGTVLVALGNNYAATERQILHHAGEVARATAVYEINSGQAAALGTVLAAFGVRAELAGSAMGRALRTIEAGVKGSAGELQSLADLAGVSGEEFKAAWERGPIEALQLFLRGLEEVRRDGGNVAETLAGFGLEGEEVLKVLPVLAKESGALSSALKLQNEEWGSGTALVEEYQRAAASMAAQQSRLAAQFAQIRREVGQQLAPAYKALTGSLEAALAAVVGWLQRGDDLQRLLDEIAPKTERAAEGFENLAKKVEKSAEALKLLLEIETYNRLLDELAAAESRLRGMRDEDAVGVEGSKLKSRIDQLREAIGAMPDRIDAARAALVKLATEGAKPVAGGAAEAGDGVDKAAESTGEWEKKIHSVIASIDRWRDHIRGLRDEALQPIPLLTVPETVGTLAGRGIALPQVGAGDPRLRQAGDIVRATGGEMLVVARDFGDTAEDTAAKLLIASDAVFELAQQSGLLTQSQAAAAQSMASLGASLGQAFGGGQLGGAIGQAVGTLAGVFGLDLGSGGNAALGGAASGAAVGMGLAAAFPAITAAAGPWGAAIGAAVGLLGDMLEETAQGFGNAAVHADGIHRGVNQGDLKGQTGQVLRAIEDQFNGLLESIQGHATRFTTLGVLIRDDARGARVKIDDVWHQFGDDLQGLVSFAVAELAKRSGIVTDRPEIQAALQTFAGNTSEELSEALALALRQERGRLGPVRAQLQDTFSQLFQDIEDGIAAGISVQGSIADLQRLRDSVLGLEKSAAEQTAARIDAFEAERLIMEAGLLALIAELEAREADLKSRATVTEALVGVNQAAIESESARVRMIGASTEANVAMTLAGADALAAAHEALAAVQALAISSGDRAEAIRRAARRAGRAVGRTGGSSSGADAGVARREAALRDLALLEALAAGETARAEALDREIRLLALVSQGLTEAEAARRLQLETEIDLAQRASALISGPGGVAGRAAAIIDQIRAVQEELAAALASTPIATTGTGGEIIPENVQRLRDQMAQLDEELTRQLGELGEEALIGLGGRLVAAQVELRQTADDLRFLFENLDVLGITAQQVAQAVQEGIVPDLLAIGEAQARRVGDEETLARLQEQRQRFELIFERIRFENMVATLQLAGALNEELMALVIEIRGLFDLPTAPTGGGSRGALPTSSQVDNVRQLREELENILSASERSQLGPAASALARIFDTFARAGSLLRAVSASAEDWARAARAMAGELAAFWQGLVIDPAQQRLAELRAGRQTPAQRFLAAQTAFQGLNLGSLDLQNLDPDQIQRIFQILDDFQAAGVEQFGEGFSATVAGRQVEAALQQLIGLVPSQEELTVLALEHLQSQVAADLGQVRDALSPTGPIAQALGPGSPVHQNLTDINPAGVGFWARQTAEHLDPATAGSSGFFLSSMDAHLESISATMAEDRASATMQQLWGEGSRAVNHLAAMEGYLRTLAQAAPQNLNAGGI